MHCVQVQVLALDCSLTRAHEPEKASSLTKKSSLQLGCTPPPPDAFECHGFGSLPFSVGLQKRMGAVLKKAGFKGQLVMCCVLLTLFVFLVILLLYT